jgi:hypothetical protein
MDVRIEDIDECESQLCEEFHIALDLVSYWIDDDSLSRCCICEDISICPGLLIEELAEDYIGCHGIIVDYI